MIDGPSSKFLHAPAPQRPLAVHLERIEGSLKRISTLAIDKKPTDCVEETLAHLTINASPTQEQSHIDLHNLAIRHQVYLGVPVDMVQRIQSPPVSPVPPNWMQENVEAGPECTDPFPDAKGCAVPEETLKHVNEFEVDRKIEYRNVQHGAPRISVDFYKKPEETKKAQRSRSIG